MTVLAVASNHANTRWGIASPSLAMNGPVPAYATTTAAAYDSTYADGYITADRGESEFLLDMGSNQSEFWLHFECYAASTQTNAGVSLIEFYSAAGTLQFAFTEKSGANTNFEAKKSTDGTSLGSALGTSAFVVPAMTRTAYDIHIKVHAPTGKIEVFSGGVLELTYSGDTSTNGDNAVRYIVFKNEDAVTAKHFSQVVAATTSTIGWKVQDVRPLTGTQDFNQWTGAYSDVDDFGYDRDKVTTIYTDTANNVMTFPTENTAAGAASMSIQAVVVSARAFTENGASADNLQLGVSISGTFYPSSTFTVGENNGEILCQYVLSNNPAGGGWNHAAVDALQIGVKAIA